MIEYGYVCVHKGLANCWYFDGEPNFGHRSYEPSDILRWTISQWTNPEKQSPKLKKNREEALTRWRQLRDDFGAKFPPENELKRVKEFADIFNKYFFFDVLGKYSVLVELSKEQHKEMMMFLYGSADSTGKILGGVTIPMRSREGSFARIQINMQRGFEDQATRFKIILSVLLHEQLHAFIYMLHCPSIRCAREAIGIRKGERFPGHGWLWSTLAQQLQYICEAELDIFLCLHLDSNVTLSDREVLERDDVKEMLREVLGSTNY
ncbi:hypothetical protein MMC12_000410 [Toensbergia leucococca]|nr:hypothetical protein [Toensbergia leucococca]